MLKLSSSFDVQKSTLTFFGFLNPGTNRFYIWYSLFMWIVFVFFFLLFQVIFIFKVSDVKDVSAGLYLTVSEIFCAVKLIHFHMNYPKIQKLFDILDSTIFQPQSPEELKVLKKAQRRASWLTKCLYTSCLSTVSIYAISPFLDASDKHKLFLSAWYPWDMENTTIYIFTYLFEVVGLTVCCGYVMPTDTIIYCLLIIINGHIERLGVRLQELGYKPLSNDPNIPPDEKMVHIEGYINDLTRKKGSIYYGEVVKCIILHKEILKYVEEFESIYNNVIFVQFSVSTLIYCMTGYEIITMSQNSIGFLTRLLYLGVVVVELFLLCLTGNEIIYTSRKLTDQIVSCDFHKFDNPTKKTLIIFMTMTIKDIMVQCRSVIRVNLSLQVFVTILKHSYSFFAVLQSMQE